MDEPLGFFRAHFLLTPESESPWRFLKVEQNMADALFVGLCAPTTKGEQPFGGTPSIDLFVQPFKKS